MSRATRELGPELRHLSSTLSFTRVKAAAGRGTPIRSLGARASPQTRCGKVRTSENLIG